MGTFAEEIERWGIDYYPQGPNSNSVVNTVLTRFGLGVPFLGINAPGQGVLLKPEMGDAREYQKEYAPNQYDTGRIWENIAAALAEPKCFAAGTSILLASGETAPIESLRLGELVACFDSSVDQGRGALLARPVVRLFRNLTAEFVELSNGLVVTPGHHFLTEAGEFLPIEEILRQGQPVVQSDGSAAVLSGTYLRFEAANAERFEVGHHWATPIEGSNAFAPKVTSGWLTYNFEVEGVHTYVAGCIRVHNQSVFTASGKDLTIGAHYTNAQGEPLRVNANGSITNLETGYTSPGSSQRKLISVAAVEAAGGHISPALQYSYANAGLFSHSQDNGPGPMVTLASGATVAAGTVFGTGDGYTYVVNSNGSVTNVQTGYTTAPGTQTSDSSTSTPYYNHNQEAYDAIQAGQTSYWNSETNQLMPLGSVSNPRNTYGDGGSTASSSGSSESSGSSGSSESSKPVLIDLDNDGIEIDELTASNFFQDLAGDGLQHRTAWAGNGDGVLVYDANNDGQIKQRNEIDFTEWAPGSETDMQALRAAFDTNQDGVLNASDADWALFKVLVTNSDGTVTLRTMSELGITSIGLISNNQEIVLADGSKILGTTTYTKSDGSTGKAADAVLAYDADGYVVTQTATTNGDGSKTIKNVATTTEGQVGEVTTSTISADGNSRTTLFDNNGDGVTDRVQTETRVVNGDGSVTETAQDYDGSGMILTRKQVTVTSADLKTVTVSRDFDGSGVNDQVETRVTAVDGALTVTLTNLNADGSTHDKTITSTSVDGLSKIIQIQLTGTGVVNATRTIDTSVAGDGTRTETSTDYAGSTVGAATRIGSTITVISADGSKSISTDLDGNASIDLSTITGIVHNSDGSDTTTQSVYNGDSSLRGRVVTQLSANGQSETTQSDLDGNGTIDLTQSDVKSVAGDGTTTRTIISKAGNNVLLKQSVETWSADGKTRSTSVDSNGDGQADQVLTVAPVTGNSVETLSVYSPNGSTLVSRSVTTTDSSGLSQTAQVDADGNSVYDATSSQTTVINGDGSSTVTTIAQNGDGTIQVAKTVLTTSADGLSETTQSYLGSATSPFKTVTDVTVKNGDNSVTQTVTSFEGTSLVQSGKVVATISADRLTTTTKSYVGTNSLPELIITSVTASSGSKTETVSTYSTDGATLISRAISVSSADGLTQTTTVDANGDTVTDGAIVSAKTLNTDGTITLVETSYAGSGTNAANKVAQTTTTTSGNGLTLTKVTDENGDGTADGRVISVAAYNADGSATSTVTTQNGDGTTQTGKVITTVSDDGLSTTQSVFLGSHTSADAVSTDVTTLGTDGSTTQVRSAHSGNNTLVGQTTTTKSEDGLSTTVSTDLNGDGAVDETLAATTNADGLTSTVVSTYGAGGALTSRSTTTLSATGLSASTSTDIDGNGTIDKSSSDVTVLNTDGSRTRTISDFNANGSLKDKTTISTSADGLTIMTAWDGTGGGTTTRSRTEVSAVNADGSTTKTTSIYNANGSLHDRTIVTANATGLSVTTTEDIDGNGVVDHTTVRTRNADGSVTTSRMDGSVLSAGGRLYGSQRGSYLSVNATGLVSTLQFDANGDSLAERQIKSATTLSTDGTKVETITRSNLSGGTAGSANPVYTETLKEKAVVTSSANGLSTTTQWDLTGAGTLTDSRTDVVVLNADGSSTQTISTFTGAALKARYAMTESADGLTATVQWDSAGSGTFTEVSDDVTVKNADGTTTRTVANTTNTGMLISKFVTTTSADGRTVTIQKDFNGAGTYTETETTNWFTAADGSTTLTRTVHGTGNVLHSKTTTVTSGDSIDITITRDANGDGVTDQTEVIKNAVDGTMTRTVTDWSTTGVKLSQLVTTRNPDGLLSTTLRDIDGDGINDRSTTHTWTYNADGSANDILQVYKISDKVNGVAAVIAQVLQQTVTTTLSADGTVTTTTVDVDGNGSVDETSTTTRRIDGSSATTIADNAAAKALPPSAGAVLWTSAVATTNRQVASATTITVSNDENKRTIQADYDGNGTYEHTETWKTKIDGSQVATITDVNGSSVTVASGTQTISADGRITTLSADTDMNGTQDHLESSEIRVDGSVIKTVTDYNPNTTLKQKVVTTVGANGQIQSYNITGGAANETITGGAGDDTLNGQGGVNTLVGGGGNDTYILGVQMDDGEEWESTIVETDSGGVDTIYTAQGIYGLPAFVENVVFQLTAEEREYILSGIEIEEGSDLTPEDIFEMWPWTVIGNNLDNQIVGANDTRNYILGLGGDDILIGGRTGDTLHGMDGNDTLYSGGTSLALDSLTPWNLPFDELEGGEGSDTYIVSGGYCSVIDGGISGIDTLVVGFVQDLATASLSLADDGNGGYQYVIGVGLFSLLISGPDLSFSDIDYVSFAGIEAVIDGSGATWTMAQLDTLLSSPRDLVGDANSNFLTGGTGNDTLKGLGGADFMWGGEGNDTYIFTSVADSVPAPPDEPGTMNSDWVFEFGSGDKIDLSLIDANVSIAGDQPFSLDTDGSFSAGEIRQSVTDYGLLLEMNVDGGADTEMCILVDRTTALTGADFIL